MIDPTSTPIAEFENRLPAAYSQGFAHVRIVTPINPDDPGPLGGRDFLDIALASEGALDSAPKAPLDDLLRAD
jgi:hypothetical protein